MPDPRAQPLAKGKHRILLVEDHPVTREGLAQLLSQQTGLEVCGQAGTPQEALRAAQFLRPDLVVLDISLGAANGLELIKDFAIHHAALPILVLSAHDELLYAERVLRAGAKGYVMKHEPTQKVLAAVREVLGGGVYLSDQMRNRLLHQVAGSLAVPPKSELAQLSDRELEVFELIGRGSSTARIAAALHVSVSTVETHRAHIKEKLELESGTELIRRAVAWVQSAAS
ncbi:MAG TPA: response regulator transcription factor [Candidatus Acidoferrum sp.]|nr:response regulator transcription factor [Candidatus Acidoferrum sp.]